MKQDVNRRVWWVLALAVVWGLSGTLVACAQEPDGEKPAVSPAAEAEDAKQEAAKPVRGRLPNHYGKLGISQEQRTRIYTIQAEYRERLAELQEQIEQLENREMQDVENVLTDEQREELREHLREAAARRAARLKPGALPADATESESAPDSRD